MPRIAHLAFFFAAILTIAANAARADEGSAQPYSLDGTKVVKFHSDKVNTDYLLYLGLPRDYETRKESYPVVFVLDADYCFAIVQQITRFLSDHDEVSPLVVVGIAYPGVAQEKYGPIHKLSRTRDYTPTHLATGGYGAEFQKQSGGANGFLYFIEHELTPYLESNYRLKHDRTIVGYSYGGLLATYSMLTKPSLFQRYIIVSPSLWYDKHAISRLQKETLSAISNMSANAFFAVGSRERNTYGQERMVGDLMDFVGKMKEKNCPNFRSMLWIAEGETHHSVFPGAAMRGIRFIFSNTQPVDAH